VRGEWSSDHTDALRLEDHSHLAVVSIQILSRLKLEQGEIPTSDILKNKTPYRHVGCFFVGVVAKTPPPVGEVGRGFLVVCMSVRITGNPSLTLPLSAKGRIHSLEEKGGWKFMYCFCLCPTWMDW
jgi:hypothetical protein